MHKPSTPKYKFALFITIFTLVFSLVLNLGSAVASAATTLSNFTVSNASAISGQLISLNWSGNETNGYNLLVSCAQGVKLKKEDGSVFPCDTKVATSILNTDSQNFYIVNISGAAKSEKFTIFPKNQSGSEQTNLSQTQSITVSPASSPISSATLSATTTTSGGFTTVSWTSSDLDGANLILSCIDGVTFTNQVGSPALPCGNLAFSDKQAGTGSAQLYFKNTSLDTKNIEIKILPYIGNGSYDLTHSTSVFLDVVSDKASPFQINSFYASQPKIASGDTLSLSWSTKYTNGVNLKFDCADSLSFSLATSTAATTSGTQGLQSIQCNDLFTNTYFAPNSSADVVITNSSPDVKTAYITLLAQLPTGGFDGINSRKIAVQVYSKGSTFILGATTNSTTNVTYGQTQNVISNSVIGQSTQTQSSNIKLSSPRKKFLKSLSFGSRGDDVSALQEFLSKNGYYPEGLVTGYLGNATVKAIKKFQEQNGVVKPGQAGYGLVGPITRSKLNSL